MSNPSTEQLNHRLKSATLASFPSYLKELSAASDLQEFFSCYISQNNITPAEIIRNSGISQSYAHEILNGKKPHPSRDYLLALCLGANMDLNTTQHALRIAQLGELYSKVPRDAAIMLHINQKQWNITKLNLFLTEHNLDIIHYAKNLTDNSEF
ncbi:helix-turn-helix domain-containing protein [Anaerostipes sp.]|uniref:helix-turn-helix domain-containing protein n=1 Tax=Anaerostipes sp. TaxID=1872530 RepID=UPI00258CE722|nr:helix-turn-helix transcriptional regulator [Anaerostipes sp.]MCI5623596.1 helix-turn-helix domain-containing protein [Anaerostipes sp.]